MKTSNIRKIKITHKPARTSSLFDAVIAVRDHIDGFLLPEADRELVELKLDATNQELINALLGIGTLMRTASVESLTDADLDNIGCAMTMLASLANETKEYLTALSRES